jgi:hypothetical protein
MSDFHVNISSFDGVNILCQRCVLLYPTMQVIVFDNAPAHEMCAMLLYNYITFLYHQ